MDIDKILLEAWSYFGRALLIFLAYTLAKFLTEKGKSNSLWKVYIKTTVAIFLIVLFLMAKHGTHTEYPDGWDGGLYEHGETVQDFEPTNVQRYSYGLTMFIVFLIPALMGTTKGFNSRKYGRDE